MSAPLNKVFRSLPVVSNSLWDSVPDVDGALGMLDQGYFFQASLLVDAMMRDDRIHGVLSTRIGALKAATVDCRPANAKAKAAKIAEEIGGSDDAPGKWGEIFSPAAIGDLTKWGLMLGIGVAQIVWVGSPDGVVPRLVPWHPQFIRFNWSDMTYRVQVAFETEVILPRVDQNPQSDGKWVVWCPYGYYYGWLQSLVRPLARKFIMRGWADRDWTRYNEIHGAPISVAYVPTGASQEEKEAFYGEVSNRGAEPTVMAPVGQDETRDQSKWGVELVEATARTYDSFRLQKEALDIDIAIAVLGQNLTTQVDGGSYAAASEHTLVRIDKALEDAKLADCLREQVLTHWARENYGDPELAPRPHFQVEPAETETEEGAAYKALGDGVAALKTAGFAVDVRAIGDARGVPMLSEEEEAAQKAQAVQDAADAMAARGGPPGGPGAPPGAGGPPAKQPPPGPGGKAEMAARYVQVPPLKRYTFQGLPIAVENPKGTTRFWHDEHGGETGQTMMQADYGYIEGHMGSDGEELDCYVGMDENAPDVHVVHQLKAPDYRAHDEDKTMIGYADAGAAKAAFLAHRNDGEAAFGGMSTVPLERFKAKLQRRTSTGKIRAEMPEEMLARAQRMIQAAAPGRARHRAKLYGDRVADKAVARAERAIGPDLAVVQAIIAEAKNLDEIRPRLLKAFKKMDPARLSELAFRARALARMGGQASAVRRL